MRNLCELCGRYSSASTFESSIDMEVCPPCRLGLIKRGPLPLTRTTLLLPPTKDFKSVASWEEMAWIKASLTTRRSWLSTFLSGA